MCHNGRRLPGCIKDIRAGRNKKRGCTMDLIHPHLIYQVGGAKKGGKLPF